MLVKKAKTKNDTTTKDEYRLVIDYRKLNAVTKLDSYSLPRIDDLLDTLGKATIFSALDMTSGFHQIPMEEDSIEKTAFTTKFGNYKYVTLPMGLCNSPSTFQRLVDIAFRPLLNKFLVCYVDDLNVYSNSNEEHLDHLEQVFKCCRIAGLTFNPSKCDFFKNSLKFLGYIVTAEGLMTDPMKVEKIKDYPVPKSITQIRSFIGLASYYRRFVKNFATIVRPLHEQTKQSNTRPWSKETAEAFEKLKSALISAPILVRPDFDKPFILVTDASKMGLGCILTQLDDEGIEHPISYLSRGVKNAEANYGISKLECLACIWEIGMC